MYYIVTDSSTDMPQSWVEAQHDFHIVSLSCTINGVSSVPGTSEVAKKETYRQLRSGVVIKTSAVNTATWEECFQKLLDEGQDVLCITFSSGLSGTYAAAADAAKELAPKYPNQKIIVIDSRCASAGEGLLVHYALQNREQGMPIEENAKWVKEHIQHLIHWFTVDDLMFLYRGGRILANRVKEHIVNPEGQMIFISHGDCEDEANALADIIKAEIPGIAGVLVTYVGPVIGSHSGPGTLAIFFLGDHR